jgi:hypothetical protein
MKKRIRLNLSVSFKPTAQDFAQFASSFRPNITAAQWMELRAVLEEIFVLANLAERYDIRARMIAEPLFLRKESQRHYINADIIEHLEGIGDVGELLEVGYRASQQPITIERLCEGIERMKFKKEELRQQAADLKARRELARANAVSL